MPFKDKKGVHKSEFIELLNLFILTQSVFYIHTCIHTSLEHLKWYVFYLDKA